MQESGAQQRTVGQIHSCHMQQILEERIVSEISVSDMVEVRSATSRVAWPRSSDGEMAEPLPGRETGGFRAPSRARRRAKRRCAHATRHEGDP